MTQTDGVFVSKFSGKMKNNKNENRTESTANLVSII
jgi:hypothetical protein